MKVWASLLALGVMVAATTNPTLSPTTPPTPLDMSVPVQKLTDSKYKDCTTEVYFAIDMSGSVNRANQQLERDWVAQLMVYIERSVASAKFFVSVFGATHQCADRDCISDDHQLDSTYTEVMFNLSRIQNNVPGMVQDGRSQLDQLMNYAYRGTITPTWEAMELISDAIARDSDPSVQSRFAILVTDGQPNDGIGTTAPGPYGVNQPEVDVTTQWLDWIKDNGTLVMTIGTNLPLQYEPLMVEWASEPNETLAVPQIAFDELQELIDKILVLMCPVGDAEPVCLEPDETELIISGEGFLNTGSLTCRFVDLGEGTLKNEEDSIFGPDSIPSRRPTATYYNPSKLGCSLPEDFYTGEYQTEYAIDGRGYRTGPKFQYGTLCRPSVVGVWWPILAVALLPLAFLRKKKTLPTTTQKITRGVAKAAPALTEEYEEYEEVEEIVAPPPPVNKWKVAPTAYIGFGKARMSVDWAGAAPESAPHEGVRKKVVKKVVSSTPVATAGPAPDTGYEDVEAVQPEVQQPQYMEEPDWVNDTMDKISALCCCCCTKKK